MKGSQARPVDLVRLDLVTHACLENAQAPVESCFYPGCHLSKAKVLYKPASINLPQLCLAHAWHTTYRTHV